MIASQNLQQKVSPLNEGGRHQMNPQQLNMSDIAARLRIVHAQMQNKKMQTEKPSRIMTNATAMNDGQWQSVHDRLDEISRAILAEHHSRRLMHEKLLQRLEKIGADARVENTVQMPSTSDMLQELEIIISEKLQNSFEQQTKKLVSDVQKTNIEVFRQLREMNAAARYSPQLAALESQINALQNKLNADNTSQPKTNAVQNGIKTAISLNKPDGTSEKQDALQKVVHGLAIKDNVTNQPADTQTKSEKKPIGFDAKKSAEMIAMVRQGRMQQQSAVTAVKPAYAIGAKMTRILAVALMLVFACGMYIQFKA